MRVSKQLLSLLIATLIFGVCYETRSQTCPVDSVCYSREQNADILKKLNEYIAAKDLIIKLTGERGAAGAVIDAANKVIEAMNQREEINGQIILKLKDLNAVYEKVIALQQTLMEKLTAKINAPKSAWQKLLSGLKVVADIALGIAIGRAIP